MPVWAWDLVKNRIKYYEKLKGEIMAETGKQQKTLIAFKSGHYKEIKGKWMGDKVWCHFKKDSGGDVHINKDEVEYMETFE